DRSTLEVDHGRRHRARMDGGASRGTLDRLPTHASDPEEVDMVGALLLGFVCGVIARVLMPGMRSGT
ncbi:MAG TPA: hypothetical protein VJ931_03105, partial [Actinomycetota bacterium]|nr:hypothetical protein [Actinomycetota bacterium]